MTHPAARSDNTIVQMASNDYMALYTIEDYIMRVKRYRQWTPDAKMAIYKLKELNDKGFLKDNAKQKEVREFMDATFRLRKFDIFEKSLSVRNAVQIYPGLTSLAEIRHEFEKIAKLNVDEYEHHVRCVLKNYGQCQAAASRTYICSNPFCTEALDIIRSGETNKAILSAAEVMIYSCAQSQRRWSNVVYRVHNIKYLEPNDGENLGQRPHPTIHVFQNPFLERCAKVYCEDTLILSDIHFYDAVLACYYLYYVFNIDYPAVDSETFQPFDEVKKIMTM